MPVVELILPYLDTSREGIEGMIDEDVYNEVIVDLKLLSLKSYDSSLHIHDFLNAHCTLKRTVDYKFVEEILLKDKIDTNLEECMKAREVDLKSKFPFTYLAL